MFDDLDWGWAFKRAAFVVVIYLALMYVLSRAAPESFGLQTQEEWFVTLGYAFFFFFVFAIFYAFIERSRRRRMASSQQPKKKEKDDEEREPGPLKGKPNPNASRKKSTRRKR
jgi:flagellar biosynthesis/type III secretory pathway M-ring protein FliF/YscJ